MSCCCCEGKNFARRSLSSWNYLIKELSQRGQGQEALQAFYQMQVEGSIPCEASYVCAMSGFTGDMDLHQGKRLHSLIMHRSFHLNVIVATALISMYVRRGKMLDAKCIFDNMPIRNVVTWTMMIAAHGKLLNPLCYLNEMLWDGVFPNKITFVSLFGSCDMLNDAKRMHTLLLACGCEEMDVIVSSALVRMYSRCGSHVDALKTFDEACSQNVVLWTAVIATYADHGHGKQALQMYHQMLQEGFLPNKVTFITLLAACVGCASLALGKSIHACITQFEFKSDVVVETALVSMYGKCSDLKDACDVFINMRQQNVVSWNAMVGAYIIVEKIQEAFQLYRQMLCTGVLATKVSFVNLLSACASQEELHEGRRLHACIQAGNWLSDAEVQNTLLSLYAKCGSIESATRIFHDMSNPNTISYNAMISMYTDYKLEDNAIQLLETMWQKKLVPNIATFTSILIACASQAALTIGKLVYACITEEGLKPDNVLWAALVNMYGKCGSINDAWRIFVSSLNRDVVVWSAIIAAYAQYGKGWQAIQLFERMQHEGVLPNKITFTSIFLACSHTGLINEGIYYLTSMLHKYGIMPVSDHVVCMIDLLGRAGRVEEAENLLHVLPCEAISVSLATLLRVYKDEANMGQGESIARLLMELDPENTASYVLLSNMCCAATKNFLRSF